jgi:hypothetical protein
LFCRSVLGVDTNAALWGLDAAEIVLLQWAHYERESGKAVNWGAGQSVLDRVTAILNRELANGANA